MICHIYQQLVFSFLNSVLDLGFGTCNVASPLLPPLYGMILLLIINCLEATWINRVTCLSKFELIRSQKKSSVLFMVSFIYMYWLILLDSGVV